MVPQNCDSFRNETLGHFADGIPLTDDAKAHYVDCESCIAAVTELLDENVNSPGVRVRGGATIPDAAQMALQHGREVFKREIDGDNVV